MAKFTIKNIEFKDDQKAVFGTGDDSAIYWDGALSDMRIETTISGVDPIQKYHLTTKEYVDTAVSGAASAYLNWTINPTYNGDVNLLGWYTLLDAGQTLDSSVFTVSNECHHAHIVLNTTATTGALPLTVTVSGMIVDEITG